MFTRPWTRFVCSTPSVIIEAVTVPRVRAESETGAGFPKRRAAEIDHVVVDE